jgi:hypothetical protein
MKDYISRYVFYAKRIIVMFIGKNHLHSCNGFFSSTIVTWFLKPCSCIWGVIQNFNPY